MSTPSLEMSPDPFDAWYEAPLSQPSDDPRIEVRRADPSEYERVYDVVDAAFGKKRPRPLFDWMYRLNPSGRARCWLAIERETGAVLKVSAAYPWPIWCGDERLRGTLSGDSATVPEWQRKGLSHVRRPVIRSHPWWGKGCFIAVPNENSRAVIHKSGRSETILGRLRAGVVFLRSASPLERAGLPAPLAGVAGAAADALLSAWSSAALSHPALRIEEVPRFDAAFDPLTYRLMSTPQYWSPHNADFLNWRYLDHPIESYCAFAVVEDERPIAYAVLRIAREEASLAEFAVDPQTPGIARALLAHVLETARSAGCAHVVFQATPGFRHWGFLRRSGFLPYRSKNFLEAGFRERGDDVHHMHKWQLVAGDRDFN